MGDLNSFARHDAGRNPNRSRQAVREHDGLTRLRGPGAKRPGLMKAAYVLVPVGRPRSRPEKDVLTDECYGTDMPKRLTRSGNSLALVIDRPLLEALEIDLDTELELSTDGDVLIVTPLRDRKRKKRTADLVAEAHEQYGGVFRRLAE